jgi:cell division septal protein FtsQ
VSVLDLDRLERLERERDARVLPFRRRPFAAKRRRKSLWLVAASGLAGALVVVGAPLGLVVWVLSSPRFALRVVDFDGGARVTAGFVHGALAPLLGRNLVALPIAEVRSLLAAHPWIDGIEVRKQLPDRLVVRIAERAPVALLRAGADLWYLDSGGRRIAPFAAADGAVDLLVVSSSSDVEVDPGRALALAKEIAATRPEWSERLSEIEVLGDEDFCVYTAALPFPLYVRAGTLAERGRSLAEMLPEIARRYPKVQAVDLRFERRIVIQPAALPKNARPAGKPGEAPLPSAPAPARAAA